MRFSVSNDLDNLAVAAERINAFFGVHGVPRKAAFAINVSVDELLTNVIKYGYRDSDIHEIELAVRIAGDEIVVEIHDDGVAFDPTLVKPADTRALLRQRPIGGLGIHMTRKKMDRFVYRREDGRNITIIAKSWRPAPAGTP